MKNKILFLTIPFFLFLWSVSSLAQQPPYWGTIFIDPDIITDSDPSTLESVTYAGQGSRVVFDRRVNGWVTIDAYLFDVVWSDGLTSEAQVNPEFGTSFAASVQAEKYAWAIGQLPTCLRVDVDEIWIHAGTELFGGGNFSILIHTGQSANYERDGILEETLVHEACHSSLDAAHAASPGWLDAQQLDGNFISTYARDNPTREDIAESFLPWLAVRYRSDRISQQDYDLITQTIPNRLNYFDNMNCDMFPIEGPATSTELVGESKTAPIVVFPNPTNGWVQIRANERTNFQIKVLSSAGQVIQKVPAEKHQQVDMTHLQAGLYFLELSNEQGTITKKVFKQ